MSFNHAGLGNPLHVALLSIDQSISLLSGIDEFTGPGGLTEAYGR